MLKWWMNLLDPAMTYGVDGWEPKIPFWMRLFGRGV